MAVYSMTGYACLHFSYSSHSSAEKTTQTTLQADAPRPWRLTLELRSVNSRFLDLSFKLPDELRPFEAAMRDLLQKHLQRGKMELRAQLESGEPGVHGGPLALPNPQALHQLAHVQSQVLTWFPQAAPLSVADILRAASNGKPSLPANALQDWLLGSLRALIEHLQATRQTEGAQLAQTLRSRTQQLRALCEQAQPLIPRLVAQQRERFLEKWQEALQQAGSGSVPAATAQERALSEAAALALRIDVAEELDRIQAHLHTIDALLEQGGALGKRLDFLMQELHREANTFGSKSSSLDTSHIGIDMKVLIEQMREQVQNIE
ncbi:MAG: YicC/YloC family endoribonuclease [Brachymonas sp.]|nr:YicC/YloC family endoribonuclease [Brachymonas sp.]